MIICEGEKLIWVGKLNWEYVKKVGNLNEVLEGKRYGKLKTEVFGE